MARAASARSRTNRRRPRRQATRRPNSGALPLANVLSRAPQYLRYAGLGIMVLAGFLAINGLYQVIRKPSELFFPVDNTFNKTPAETWDHYGAAFREKSTPDIPPELLAALAQMEAAGNPVARTYWRWSFTVHPFDIYKPASSSVGMYQMTDGTFAQAKDLCIRDHQVRHAGAWHDWNSCWFNAWYLRIVPSDAIELTSAYLDEAVSSILARHHLNGTSPQQKENLAAVVHLCGAGAADGYARRGFKFTAGQRCGDHDPREYLSRVTRYEREFTELAARS
jgi:hypothetical protein